MYILCVFIMCFYFRLYNVFQLKRNDFVLMIHRHILRENLLQNSSICIALKYDYTVTFFVIDRDVLLDM